MNLIEHLPPALAEALAKRGYDTLTPVQEAVSADAYADRDLVVSAQTGSGKTVAFGLNMGAFLLGGETRFEAPGEPLGLVIAPTRELAMQVQRELDWLYASAGGRVVACVGGMDAREERRALAKGAHFVVGTPGRLVDHLRRGALVMHSLRCVVLDEADEMLNMGFREELETILDASPDTRRTLMFSATMPKAIERLAQTYQRDAARVNTVTRAAQHVDIDYRALVTAGHDVENAIFNVLRYYDAPNAIVFCATRAAVSRMMSRFTNRGLSVVAMSGELSQAERSHALQALRDHRAQVCIATDVAARGIDLPDLELVIHGDLPRNTEALLHRSGRTGRAGRKGTSVLIVPHRARKRVERLLRDAKVSADWADPPSADEIVERDNARLLADPALSGPVPEADGDLVRDLLASHGAEAVAAAFIAARREGRAAPEDLAPTPAYTPTPERAFKDRPPRAPREDFKGGVWVSLSIGRKRNAEPRWLIPMLCKAGGMTKGDLGAIRIQDGETHVEIAPGKIDGFMAAVGSKPLEKGITVTRIEGTPSAPARPAKPPRKPRTEGKPVRRAPPREDAGASETPRAKPKKKRGPPVWDAKPAGRKPKGGGGKAKGPSKTPPSNPNKRKFKKAKD